MISIGSYYIAQIKIYEPIKIKVNGVRYKQERQLELFFLTPFNRSIKLRAHAKNTWKDNLYCKEAGIIIHDSIAPKITSIDVFINDTTYNLNINELIAYEKNNGLQTYLLPPSIKSSFTLGKFTKNILHSKIVLSIFIFVLLLVLYKILNRFPRIKKYFVSKKKVKFWQIAKIVTISFVVAASLFYGYLFIVYTYVSWATSILLIILLFLITWYLGKMINKRATIKRKIVRIIKIAIIVVFVSIFALESFLRVIRKNASYNELNGIAYSSGFLVEKHLKNTNTDDAIWTHHPHETLADSKKEFSYNIYTNNEGLRDIDHPIEKEADEIRIICLGHSFTEGIGAPQDSTWPYLLQNILDTVYTDQVIRVFNSGISGSDVFYEYHLLEKRLLKYSPDLVLLSLGDSDFGFYNVRGGFDRFTPNGIRYHKAPPREKLYAISYIFRYVLNDMMNYEGLFSREEYDALYSEALIDIQNSIYQYKTLAHNADFILVPVFINDRGVNYFPIIKKLKEENKIPIINLFDYTDKVLRLSKNEIERYFWKIDGHCNSDGYQMFADGVFYNLEKMGIIDSLKSNNSDTTTLKFK